MKRLILIFILLEYSCNTFITDKTTYYTQYIVFNKCSEKVFLNNYDHFPNQTYHNWINYIDSNHDGIIFMTHFLSKQEYDKYTSCLYLDSIKGETYISKKILQTQLINPSRWEMQIINGDHTITKRYIDTLFDYDFQ